jgi:maleamate amidohydrolase
VNEASPPPVITDGLPSQIPDVDPEETREWLDSLDAVIDGRGRTRARYLILRLLEAARARGVPVANCYVVYPNAESLPHWKVAMVRDLIRGSEACELDPRIVDHDRDFVFEKYGASAFFMSPCASWLTTQHVDTIAVAGCVTSGCVRASVVDAFQFGFRTLLIEDCSGDMDEGPHRDTLRDVGRRYADIVSSDDVMRYISANDRQR